MHDATMAETIRISGHNGDEIDAYLARPMGAGPYPGVVVIHHMPGWDEGTKEITRKFAAHGYIGLAPNLHFREGPGTPQEMSAAVRAAGGVPDVRCIGDLEGAAQNLRLLPYSNKKIGIIGYCSGGRQAYLAACNIPSLDAAVDCYGGNVVVAAENLTPQSPVAPIDMTANLACPLLGLFGAEDGNPSPDHVAKIEQELKRLGKSYEIHTYENTGHAFFAVDRPNYRPEAAVDGWNKVFAWFERHLSA